jgi:dihydropteroate synthase
VAGGFAVWLRGGSTAFALVRDPDTGAIRPVRDVDPAHLSVLTAPLPPWAGLPPGPKVMAVLNVTPDSFSDGGRHLTPEAAIAAGRAMMAEGADILDIGGESTRPRSAPTSPAEERARVLPVIAALAAEGHTISIDTRHAETMDAALRAGARIVNDVSALAHDPDSPAVVAAHRAPVVLMHMRGDPASMHQHAAYDDIARDVAHELARRIAIAEAAGIVPHSIAIDPGIGFAKLPPENLALLPRLALLLALGRPIVVGVSRKGFIGKLSGIADPAHRAPGSIAAGLHALLHGASILRVHDVAETVQAVRVWRGLFRQ